MNVYGLLPEFKVVEINNSVALRSGHMIAQAVMAKANFVGGGQDYVENGYVLYLDADGQLKSPGKLAAGTKTAILATQAPILHYTEELFDTGLSQELKHFAVEWNSDDECYPRGLVLHIGDAFTTNNVASGTIATAAYATIDDNGAFVVSDSLPTGYTGPLFNAVPTTLPDGETDAVELTLIAEVITFA